MTTGLCWYLGAHQPGWLGVAGVRLFVSHRRLAGRRSLPRAIAPWALDSGGFSELSLYGEWRTSPAEYVAAVRRYDTEIGGLEWAAPQDWMCEPVVGLGSVCRRQGTAEIAHLVRRLRAELGVDLHGFGVKTAGLRRFGGELLSADSMAWSYDARRSAPLPGCSGHKNCANCLVYALRWRDRVLDVLDGARGHEQLVLGGVA
jgi:hypothetical protein